MGSISILVKAAIDFPVSFKKPFIPILFGLSLMAIRLTFSQLLCYDIIFLCT